MFLKLKTIWFEFLKLFLFDNSEKEFLKQCTAQKDYFLVTEFQIKKNIFFQDFRNLFRVYLTVTEICSRFVKLFLFDSMAESLF